MYCPECGFQNSEAANFCAKCGALILPDQPGGQTTMSFAPAELEPDGPGALDEVQTDQPALVIRSGGGRAGEHFTLNGDTTSIGRSPNADILLDDVTVSRDHARIRRRPDGLYIEDAASLNGTYVNRQRIESHRLEDGDELQIGKFKLTFLDR
jgi:sulfur carrier protein ThiS